MNPVRISTPCAIALASIVGLLLLWPPGALAEPFFATMLGTKLDSDIPGNAKFLDPNLVNPIGITAAPNSPNHGSRCLLSGSTNTASASQHALAHARTATESGPCTATVSDTSSWRDGSR